MNTRNTSGFKLEDLKKENPFQVPENYFDSLGMRVADHVHAKTSKHEIYVPVFARLKPILVLSSGFAGLALIIYIRGAVFFNKADNNTLVNNQELASITEYSIVSDLDNATLVENLYEENTPAKDSAIHTENKEKIIDYLVEENIDISTIIDEL